MAGLIERLVLPAALAVALGAGPAAAAPGDLENGEKVYMKRCVWCHGEEGEGDGPGAEMLNPPPRDFTGAIYKIKTSPFSEDFANDADLFRMISDGMPGTDMASWKEVLSEQERWDLVAYIKDLAELEEEPGVMVDYGTQVASSAESIAKGRELFLDQDRCSECHGKEGKGNAIKKLKEDEGARTWPRNLTKPWTYRASNGAKDIFTRIATGIPGTQMPSFADPKAKMSLSIEDRWHLANYVVSLAATSHEVRAENTVIKASRLDGELPSDPGDKRWDGAETTTFMLVPQMIAKDRVFKYANDTITLGAYYNDKDLAMLLEWDDRTKSIPGDADSDKIADKVPYSDAVAVQFPVALPKGTQKPYFAMGDATNPVNILYWNSGTAQTPQSVGLVNARGFGETEKRAAAAQGITAKGAYQDGTWKVVMSRALLTGDAGNDLQLEEGLFIPIAFANWDGSNSETGSRHTLTTWYWLLLKPAETARPLIGGGATAIIVFALLAWWARGARRKDPAA